MAIRREVVPNVGDARVLIAQITGSRGVRRSSSVLRRRDDGGLSGPKIAKPSTSLLLILSAQTPELCKLFSRSVQPALAAAVSARGAVTCTLVT